MTNSILFFFLSEIEIPTALRIRPVLKAHDITDGKHQIPLSLSYFSSFHLDFLEIEGDIPRNPVTETPVSLTQTISFPYLLIFSSIIETGC